MMPPTNTRSPLTSNSADRTLADLKAGNIRFREGRSTAKHWQVSESVRPQNPKAIILSCSDARVPAEIIFDQGPGDLFAIRVAGNIAASSQIASIEFAATQFGTPLVIVLGHTGCGAITATLRALNHKESPLPGHISEIVDHIAPNIASLVGPNPIEITEVLADQCMKANIRASIDQLQQTSEPLSELTKSDDLTICGAFYDLSTGEVSFID
ncbi:MAG: carbonic anhydrase [Pseudomonadales bacterium]